MLKKSVFFALLAATSAAHAIDLYNNTDTTGLFYTTSLYQSSADDFQFGALGTTDNPTVAISQLAFGYRTLGSTPTSFDAVVSFYQDMDITTPTNSPSTASILTTGGLDTPVKSYRFSFTNIASGTSGLTGLIDLANFGGGFTLPAISDFNTRNHGVRIAFYDTGTTTLNTSVRPLFTGAVNPSVGYSYNTYARDVNADGTITASERTFGDPDNARDNFYLRLVGQPVPEPMSLAPLALGAVAFLRRRKRA